VNQLMRQHADSIFARGLFVCPRRDRHRPACEV